MSRDGRVRAGYRARPGVVGFPAWMRLSDMVTGFRETDRVTGTHKESVLSEISRRLRRLEAQGVKVVVV